MFDLSALVSDFRQFVTAHPETKKLAFAQAIGTSPSGLSAILAGVNKPTASQALAMLNVTRGGTTRIVGLQENADECLNSHTDQRIELNDRNLAYLERFNRKVDCTLFDNSNSGRVAREGADPSEDPASGDGDPTKVRKANDEGTDDPSLENVLAQLDRLYRVIGDVLANKAIVKATPNKTGAARSTNQRFSR